jgi:hypothetical protein
MKLRYWINLNLRSVWQIVYHLPLYIHGSYWREIRQRMTPTVPRLLFGERIWTTILRWRPPRFEAAIMDGMAEHYGYPRHHARLIFFWNRRGYAFGIEASTPPKA